ncbi:hypothetical protein SAMN04488693_1394 [Arthrobacter subterraneus]|uniref:Uncharacterized protein n=1 Tax=Arthrobacter subterraneus TaxID=335973 RepID=A0A1G8PZ49_9MICC|nr:hypothetical protein [Arthrobacter subterraneus]SDI97120.1 hypothetical protein SAMN04488693_1394 [Arthrobacter subterraneus]
MEVFVDGNDMGRTRAQLSAVIEACESDIRNAVATFLLEPHSGNPLPSLSTTQGPEFMFRVARGRQKLFGGVGSSAVSGYLDIEACLDLVGENLGRFPTSLAGTLGLISPYVPVFLAIRYRTIHGRPLFARDADALLRPLQSSGLTSSWFPETKGALNLVNTFPDWRPHFTCKPVPLTGGTDNLPPANHHASVLAGRERDVLDLASTLQSNRYRISVLEDDVREVATSLALVVAYRLLDENSRFDAVLWVADKIPVKATTPGPLLKGAAFWHKGFERVARVIEEGFDAPSAHNLSEMLARIGSGECLVIVEGLKHDEASGMEQIYEMLPSTVTYLTLTSDSADLKGNFPRLALHRMGRNQ